MSIVSQNTPATQVSHEELYHRIRSACKHWGQDAEDVAHEAWIKAQNLGYFTSRTILQAARDLGIFKAAHELDITDMPIAAQDDSTQQKQRERIHAALAFAPARVRKAAELVLEGHDMCEAAEACGMSAGDFTEALRALKQRQAEAEQQLSLFRMGLEWGGGNYDGEQN